jgi:hypothetical protein
MNASEAHGFYGSVILDTVTPEGKPQQVTFNIAPLNVAEECALYAELQALVEKKRNDRVKAMIREFGAVTPASWADRQVVSELTARVVSPAEEYDVLQYRFDVDGVRCELYHRAKKSNPELTRDIVGAAVNLVNVTVARMMIDQIISGRTAHKSETDTVQPVAG